ncbi:MAG: M17 family metallopeptidase [Hyphomicrobiaceae bacterium]
MTGVAKPADLLLPSQSAEPSIPIRFVRKSAAASDLSELTSEHRAWLDATGFRPASRRVALLPDSQGGIAAVIVGVDDTMIGTGPDPAALEVGHLPVLLPSGTYHLETPPANPSLASIAWGLGAYRFTRYLSEPSTKTVRLRLPADVDRDEVLASVEAVWLGRDLINTPASDLGPAELEAATRALAERHGATVSSIVGEDLLKQNFPMIHAVGRASTRAPRLIDLSWGRSNAPKVTVIGKGICFDTGGLDIKPASSMLLMKKDMGGAAAALALGHMIMAANLDVRLRILVAAAENSISGNAFRPGDILQSRAGLTVEIGNTDAEGRLVLADALALADEESPDHLITLATLTGAARVALGPDLPPFYTDSDDLGLKIAECGLQVGDPVWRMPLWRPYDRTLDSEIADVCHISNSSFAGSVTAALFLRRFVRKAARYAHFDIYGWVPSAKSMAPKGGEPQTARALFEVLRQHYTRD